LSGKKQSLTFCAAAIALLAMIPAAGKPPDRESSTPTTEFLTDSFDPEGAGFLSKEAREYGVDLNANGLCGIDKDVAYLYGSLFIGPGTIRSLLLKTADGGKSWHEVMSPIFGSEVTNVAFSDPRHGWALAMWTIEGPGTPVLFGSRDEGKTWRQLAEIGLSPGSTPTDGFPVSMTFQSAQKGEIEIAYEDESTTSDETRQQIETLASDDGGRNWSRVRREMRVPHDDRCIDNADWELITRGLREPITVRRFDREQKLWRVTTLPTHFQYERGRIRSPR
jgi:hypothetical protein